MSKEDLHFVLKYFLIDLNHSRGLSEADVAMTEIMVGQSSKLNCAQSGAEQRTKKLST